MQFAVSILKIPDYPHTAAMADIAESLHYGLLELGLDSVLTADLSLPDRQYILLASNTLIFYPQQLPPNSILYNLEQIFPGSPWLQPILLDHFLQYPMWDYSKSNIAELHQMGITNVQHLPVGYVPQLTRTAVLQNEDIDVLFYGTINDRRRQVLSELEAKGAKVYSTSQTYGKQRDELIARSKIVLNLHFYVAKVFEVVRVSYLLANQKFVIAERSHTSEEAEFSGGLVFAEYENLVETCLDYLARPNDRQRIAAAGFELMVQRPVAPYLSEILPTIPVNNQRSTFQFHRDLHRKRCALTYLEQGQYSQAISLYEASLEVDSGCTQSYWNLGLGYFLSGEVFAAQLCWMSGISLTETEQELRLAELLQVLQATCDRFRQLDDAVADQIQQVILEFTLSSETINSVAEGVS